MTGLPIPVPYSWSVADTFTATIGNSIRDALNFLLNPPIAQLLQTASMQTIANNTWTTITWDNAAQQDTYSGYNSATSTTRYTAQLACQYRVRGVVSTAANTSGLRAARLLKNGTVVRGSEERVSPSPSATIGSTVDSEWIIPMAVGDYVELQGWQGSGGNLSTLADTDACCSLTVQFAHL